MNLAHSRLTSGAKRRATNASANSGFSELADTDQPIIPIGGAMVPWGPSGTGATAKSSGPIRSRTWISASGSWSRKAQVPE